MGSRDTAGDQATEPEANTHSSRGRYRGHVCVGHQEGATSSRRIAKRLAEKVLIAVFIYFYDRRVKIRRSFIGVHVELEDRQDRQSHLLHIARSD